MTRTDPTHLTAQPGDVVTPAFVEATRSPRTPTPWYCADLREGRRVHVDHRGNVVNGPSRLVHVGGRIECPDGRVPETVRPRLAGTSGHDDEALCRLFAAEYSGPNVTRAIALAEEGRVTWSEVADLFETALRDGLEAVAHGAAEERTAELTQDGTR